MDDAGKLVPQYRFDYFSPNPPKEGVGLASRGGKKVLLCFWDNGFVAKKRPRKGAPNRCCHATTPTGYQITFDDRRLVANAGLLLPATLARHLGLTELVRQRLDPGDAPGRANTSDKMMTPVASAPAGGDCIDEPMCCAPGGRPARRAARSRRHPPRAPSCAASRWGHVRQPTG